MNRTNRRTRPLSRPRSLFVLEICVYMLSMPQISNTKIAAKSEQIKAVNLAAWRINPKPDINLYVSSESLINIPVTQMESAGFPTYTFLVGELNTQGFAPTDEKISSLYPFEKPKTGSTGK